MTDRTLSISDALREAQLQRLEASLAGKAASKPQANNTASKREGQRRQNKRLIATVPTHSLIRSTY